MSKATIQVSKAPNGAWVVRKEKDGFGQFISNLELEELVDIYLAIETTLKTVDPSGLT